MVKMKIKRIGFGNTFTVNNVCFWLLLMQEEEEEEETNQNLAKVQSSMMESYIQVLDIQGGMIKYRSRKVSSEGHIMPPHIFEVGLKVNTKVYLDVLKRVVIPWCNQATSGRPWVWQQDLVLAHKSKETQAWLQKESYDFVPFSHCPAPPPNWTRWTTSFGHTSRTSPTWPPTTPKPAWSPPSAKYSLSFHQWLWKRHAPNSRSILRQWLRLKVVATLNRCQLYYIIKLPELIFSLKVLK